MVMIRFFTMKDLALHTYHIMRFTLILYSGRKYRPEYPICLLNGLDRHPEIEKEYDELCMHQVGD